MPIFEYKCDFCDRKHELLVLRKAPDTIPCPFCNLGRATKVLSAPAIQFRGDGWTKKG